MGHPVVNKGNKGVTLRDIKKGNYKKLLVAAQTISLKMGTAVATFVTPVPALATLDTAAGTLATAAQPMKLKRNRASKAQFFAAQAAANDVRVILLQLMSYAVNTVYDLFPEDPYQFNAALITAGFSLKLQRKPKHISQPRFVTQTNSKKFPFAMMRINWRRGTGLIKGAPIAGYLIKSVIKQKELLTAGYNDVLFGGAAPILPATLTTLTLGVDYKFFISVDGGAQTLITITADLTNKDYAGLVNSINAALITAGLGAQVLPIPATGTFFLRAQSNTLGVHSSVVLENTHTINNLFPALPNYIGIDNPVEGTDTLIPASFGVIATVTKTNAILNPTMMQRDNITGQIVPFNSFGEGNPINFTARYIT